MNQTEFNPLNLAGRHHVITGAASGIGRASAILLDRLGATLSLVDRDAANLLETLSLLGSQAHYRYEFDLEQIHDVDTLVKDIVRAGGLINGVVHCAGIQSVMPAKVLSPDVWRKIFAVNTEAGLALAKSLHSRRVYAGSHGSVIFISSIMALAGSPGAVAYAMSKSALHGITQSLALEFAPKKIRVNCIAPGFVRTPMFERTEKLWDEAQRKTVEALHPLGFGRPEDIANAVAFLAAETGRWITGTVLVVDGGYLAH